MIKRLKILRILTMGWLAMQSPCLAMRWGLSGIMAATIISGPHKGLPLGVALALDKVNGPANEPA